MTNTQNVNNNLPDLTLVIPAKNESESLPKVLKELEILKINTLIVIPIQDKTTKQSIQQFDCKIIEEKNGKGYGNALRTGINQVKTEFFLSILKLDKFKEASFAFLPIFSMYKFLVIF